MNRNVVDVLARHPVEVDPVGHLVFHFGLTFGSRSHPERSAHTVSASGNDFADRPVGDARNDLFRRSAVAIDQASNDVQALLLRQLSGFLNHFDSDPVHGDRLFGKDVLTRVDSGLDHCWTKMLRGDEQGNVDILFEHLFVPVEPVEETIFGNVDAIAVFFSKSFDRAFSAGWKDVRGAD